MMLTIIFVVYVTIAHVSDRR